MSLSTLARTALAAALLFAVAPVSAQSIDSDAETKKAQTADATSFDQQQTVTTVSSSVSPLFVGVDDATVSTYTIDPDTDTATAQFAGFQVWGAAYNPGENAVHFNSGSTLYAWDVAGGTVSAGVTMTSTASGSSLSMVGLAFLGGTLYATRNVGSGVDIEGLYSIDPSTGDATLVAEYDVPTADIDCGGIDADPNGTTLYCTNDDSSYPGGGRGLIQLGTDGSTSFVAPYPAGQTDIDGLAVGGGKAYLVTDEPGSFYVYNLVTDAYEAPLTAPWTTSEIFSGGAWIADDVASVPDVDIEYITSTEPERGESVFVSARLTNNESETVRTRVYMEVLYPNGATRTYSVLSKNVPAGFDDEIQLYKTIRIPVPANAPAGTYSVTIYAADDIANGGTIYDSDMFTFELGPQPAQAMDASGESFVEVGAPEAGPNPFSSATTIRYALASDVEVDLRVFDATGREVARLASGARAQGTHSATFEAGDLPSGVYVWRLSADGAVTTGRLTLAR